MDSFRVRGLWIVDTDTGMVCAERRFHALERLHRHGHALAALPSSAIVDSVLDAAGAKARALELCGSGSGLGGGSSTAARLTSHHLLGAFTTPQLLETVFVSSTGARGLVGGRLAGKGMGSARAAPGSGAASLAVPSPSSAPSSGDAATADKNNSITNNSNSSAHGISSGGALVPPFLPIGPFVAFSARRGVRIEAPFDLLSAIGSGLDDAGEADGGAAQRAMVDEVLTAFETHPQYGAAENLVVIAAPLVAHPFSSFYGASSSSSLPRNHLAAAPPPPQAGSLALRHLMVTALLSLQALLGPFINDTLVIGVEGAVLTAEVEAGMAAVGLAMGGWDPLCARRVVGDLTWRRAIETLLSVGMAMGRVLSVAADGPASHTLPFYGAAAADASVGGEAAHHTFGGGRTARFAVGRRAARPLLNREGGALSAMVAGKSNNAQDKKGGGSPKKGALIFGEGDGSSASASARKSLQAQALFNLFDAFAEGGEEGNTEDANGDAHHHTTGINGHSGRSNVSTHSAARSADADVDDDMDVIAALDIGPNPSARTIDLALHTAANFQTALFTEQHVAAQLFGNCANSTVAVTTHVMMVPPLKHSTRFSNRVATAASVQTSFNNDNVVCLLGGAPPPHASLWATALARAGPANNMIPPSASAASSAYAPNSHGSHGPSSSSPMGGGAGGGVGSSLSAAHQYASSDVYIRRDRALVTEIVGAPEPRPMAVPMAPMLLLEKKRLAEEGLTTSGAAHAMGLGRFITSGAWRLPALNATLPTTSSTHHLDSRTIAVSNTEAYPPITAIALATDFAELTKARRDAGVLCSAAGTAAAMAAYVGAGAAGGGGGGGASAAGGAAGGMLIVGGGSAVSGRTINIGGSERNASAAAAAAAAAAGGPSAAGAAVCQRPTSILSMVHEVPRSLHSGAHNPNAGPGPNATTAMRCGAVVGSYALVPILEGERARRVLQQTDFGQGVGTDGATPQQVHRRTRDDLAFAREHVGALLTDHHGHVLYRLDLEVTVDVGGIATVDVPKFDVVFGVHDAARVAYYHLNVFREDSEVHPTTGATSPSGSRTSYTAVGSQQLSDSEFLLSFINGAGLRVRNGTTFIVKGIVVCDVSERPAAAALPSPSAASSSYHHHNLPRGSSAPLPIAAPSEADILAAVTVYSSAALHFTMLAERPFLPGSCVLADPVVMGKCLVGGAMGGRGEGDAAAKAGGATTNANFAAAADRSNPAFGGGGAAAAGGNDPLTSSAALMVDTLDRLQKKIRAVAFSSKGTSSSLVERQLSAPIRLGLPMAPFPADGDSAATWRKSELSSPAPITAAVIVRSHPEKGFVFWNYSGDV